MMTDNRGEIRISNSVCSCTPKYTFLICVGCDEVSSIFISKLILLLMYRVLGIEANIKNQTDKIITFSVVLSVLKSVD
jgi:hypothetical protein